MKVRNTTDSRIWVSMLNGAKSVDMELDPFETKEVMLQDVMMVNVTHHEKYRPPLRKLIHEAHENTDFDHVEIP